MDLVTCSSFNDCSCTDCSDCSQSCVDNSNGRCYWQMNDPSNPEYGGYCDGESGLSFCPADVSWQDHTFFDGEDPAYPDFPTSDTIKDVLAHISTSVAALRPLVTNLPAPEPTLLDFGATLAELVSRPHHISSHTHLHASAATTTSAVSARLYSDKRSGGSCSEISSKARGRSWHSSALRSSQVSETKSCLRRRCLPCLPNCADHCDSLVPTELVDDDHSDYYRNHGFPDQMDIVMPLLDEQDQPPSQDQIDSINEMVTNYMKDVRVVCSKLVDGLPPNPPPPPPPPSGSL